MGNRKNILTIGALVLGVGIIAFALIASPDSPNPSNEETVRLVDGVQYIRVNALGGYSPEKITAKAGIPIKLEVMTKGTYDCSSAFGIPALGITKQLPPSGITTFDLPSQEQGSKIVGTCSMGMYSFEMQFI